MSKPIVELMRSEAGLPVLGMYNLTPAHIETLRGVMLSNGQHTIHDLRADARAHVAWWSPEDRMVGIELHGSSPWLFVHAVCNEVGIPAGDVPHVITDNTRN